MLPTLRIRHPYLALKKIVLCTAWTAIAVGFIRAYADHLGLDSEEVVRRFKDEFSVEGKSKTQLSFLCPLPKLCLGS